MYRGSASGKPGDGKVWSTPEEVHGAALADEAGAKLLEDPVSLNQDLPEPDGVLLIVGTVRFVQIERQGIGDFAGRYAQLDVKLESVHFLRQLRIERCHRLRPERETAGAAVAGLYRQLMGDEVEIDLEGPRAIRNRRCGEASGCDI